MNRENLIIQSFKKDCFALIVRHSIREEIHDAREPLSQLLTPEGKQLAFDFGTQLCTDKPIRLYHSIVERCKETAEHIAKGFKGEIVSIQHMDAITGFYVYSPISILTNVNHLGNYEFINQWFKGVYSDKEIMPAFEARTFMYKAIVEKYNPNYLDIFVTHDWNITLLSSLFYDVTEKNYPWPDFMHGLSLSKIQNEFFFSCKAGQLNKLEI